jgi:hypothetical protein
MGGSMMMKVLMPRQERLDGQLLKLRGYTSKADPDYKGHKIYSKTWRKEANPALDGQSELWLTIEAWENETQIGITVSGNSVSRRVCGRRIYSKFNRMMNAIGEIVRFAKF